MTSQLAGNVMHFGRALRAAGLPIGSGQIADALRALEAVGIESKDTVHAALATCFVRRREERVLFDEAFEAFFRDPFSMSQALAALVSRSAIGGAPKSNPGSRRVADAMSKRRAEPKKAERPADTEIIMAASDADSLRTRDFEKMTADEERRAHAAIANMALPHATEKTRRLSPDARGTRFDVRRTLRASLRTGGASIPLRFRGPSQRLPPLVAICDISGSMERYSRMVLHFLHALTRARPRVSSFVFGTRLTNITRQLKTRDVDESLASVGQSVADWAGGTRLGDSLRAFNKLWSRRVLGHGAVVLLITDGLERGDPSLLTNEAERLHKSCRRFIWLNPLLRYSGFEPLAGGIRALLPHVDEHRTVHHLASLEDLARALA